MTLWLALNRPPYPHELPELDEAEDTIEVLARQDSHPTPSKRPPFRRRQPWKPTLTTRGCTESTTGRHHMVAKNKTRARCSYCGAWTYYNRRS